jgi:hypothetical protein
LGRLLLVALFSSISARAAREDAVLGVVQVAAARDVEAVHAEQENPVSSAFCTLRPMILKLLTLFAGQVGPSSNVSLVPTVMP